MSALPQISISPLQMRETLSGGWPASLRQIRSAADSAASRNSVSCQSASLHNKIDGVCSFICIIPLFFLCVFLIFIAFFSFLLVELYNIFHLFTIVHVKKAPRAMLWKPFRNTQKTPEMHRIRRIISGVSLFLLLFIFIQQPEQIPYSRSGKENLPAQCHWKILRGLLQPQRDDLFSRIHEQQGCNKAHGRAHQADNHG